MSAEAGMGAVEAAWFALARAFTYTGPHDIEGAHGIVADHRPAIEAVLRRAEAGTLDEAWAAAEAALPEGCRFEGVRRSILGMKDQWVAAYSDEGGWFNFYGPTPTAALLALADALRAVPA